MKSSNGQRASVRVTVAVALIGLSGAWNAGNVGPVAGEIASEFDVSLAVVGLLAGTFFLGSVAIGLLFAAKIGERTGVIRGMRLSCSMLVLGNLIFAVTPVFIGLAVGRILPGLGFALLNTLGAVWARNAGGVRLVGIFGASIQLGIALALLLGSGLSDLGVDWRVGFVISAALAGAAFVALPRHLEHPSGLRRSSQGFLRAAVRHARVYRLSLLFVSMYGVPMILSAWLIVYLSSDGDLSTALAGAAAFLLFGLSAAMRIFGAQLQARGVPHRILGGSLGLAAIGLAALALDPIAAVAFAGVFLLAFGFGVPYGVALIEAQELYPEDPAEPIALMTLVALLPPIVAIPIIGHALSNGDGDIALGILAAFLVLATLANLRRTGIPLTDSQPLTSPEGSASS